MTIIFHHLSATYLIYFNVNEQNCYIGATAFTRGFFGDDDDLDVNLIDIHCTGGENRLVDCQNSVNQDCGHAEDVGVRCAGN